MEPQFGRRRLRGGLLAWKRRHQVLSGLLWLFVLGPLVMSVLGGLLQAGAPDPVMAAGWVLLLVLSVWFLVPAVGAFFGFDDPAMDEYWRRAQERGAIREARRHR